MKTRNRWSGVSTRGARSLIAANDPTTRRYEQTAKAECPLGGIGKVASPLEVFERDEASYVDGLRLPS